MHADAQPLRKRRLDGLARRETPVGRTLLLCACEDGRIHDGGNGQFDPVLPRTRYAPGQAPDGTALPTTGSVVPDPSARPHWLQMGCLADVGLVPQDDRHGRNRPAARMARTQALRVEPGGDLVHRQSVAGMETEDPAHDTGFAFVDLEAGTAGLGPADQTISVGCPREHVQRALTGTVDFAATRALGDLRALTFGNHRQDLAQQRSVGRAVVRLLNTAERRTASGEHLLQQDLMGKVAAQPVD